MRRVILESPLAGKTPEETAENIAFARRAARDCLLRGESPFASHLLYAQPGILRDSDQTERALGMRAGMSWTEVAEATVVYTDRGISGGMKSGISRAQKLGIPVEYRILPSVQHPIPTPTELHDLLFTIGHDFSERELRQLASTPDDVLLAVAWARGEHAARQGLPGPPRVPCPAWLEDAISQPRDPHPQP